MAPVRIKPALLRFNADQPNHNCARSDVLGYNPKSHHANGGSSVVLLCLVALSSTDISFGCGGVPAGPKLVRRSFKPHGPIHTTRQHGSGAQSTSRRHHSESWRISLVRHSRDTVGGFRRVLSNDRSLKRRL